MYKYTYWPVNTFHASKTGYYIAKINIDKRESVTFFDFDGNQQEFTSIYVTINPELYHVWHIFDSLEEAMFFAKSEVDICPSEGGFYGYKKCYLNTVKTFDPRSKDNYFASIDGVCVVTLYIPPEARRTGCYYEKKCRTEFADVIDIERINENDSLEKIEDEYWAKSMFYGRHCLDYRIGERVYSDSFDDDKSVACSNGIHFFLTKEAALAY